MERLATGSANGGKVSPDALSPVERQAGNFVLPADSGEMWSSARLVNLEKLEIEALNLIEMAQSAWTSRRKRASQSSLFLKYFRNIELESRFFSSCWYH